MSECIPARYSAPVVRKAPCFHYLIFNELFTISNERMRFPSQIIARMKFRPSVNAGEVNRARALNMEVFA
jgi:hypothetical protein